MFTIDPRHATGSCGIQRSWAVGILIGALLTSAASGQDLVQHHLFSFFGQAAFEGLGSAVIGLPDLDGDGRGDFAFGASAAFSNGLGRVEVVSSATGRSLRTFHGEPGADGLGDRFGAALALLPDLDGDGVPELAIGAPLDDDGGSQSGAVSVHSLATGALLVRLAGPGLEARLGELLLSPGDLNGDGVGDLIAAGSYSNQVRAFSGAWIASLASGGNPVGGALLWTQEGAGAFGASIALLDDLDQDQVPDLAIGAPRIGALSAPSGELSLISGATGTLLGTLLGAVPGDRFATDLAVLLDVDGDGGRELAVGLPGANGGSGRVEVWRSSALSSIAQGSGPGQNPILWSRTGSAPGEGFGLELAGGQDLNADGLWDVVGVGISFGISNASASVRLLDGRDGSLLGAYSESDSSARFGLGLALLGDLNQDGLSEIGIGSPFAGPVAGGQVEILSGASLRLAASAHLIAVDLGGSSLLSLDGGPTSGGLFYFVLGSASGTQPGTLTAIGPVPLNLDWYTYYTLAGAPELLSFAGLLDAQGRAQAAVQLPPGSNPALTGLALNYAWIGLDLGQPGVPLTVYSNAVPLGFIEDDCSVSGAGQDCNGNGIKDSCDIADGTSYDCNGNGVPDECDIASGFSLDLDQDGLPDECRTLVFVDRDAIGANNGSSWADAYTDLYPVTLAAQPYTQIWVAEGRYTPGNVPFSGSSAFTLTDRVGLYGGFVGTETGIAQRNLSLHKTILDADFLGNDGAGFLGYSDNAWTVVLTPNGITRSTVLDGFTLRGGNSEGLGGCAKWAVYFAGCEGGGLYSYGSPTVRHCRLIQNYGGHHGGGFFGTGSPLFIDCSFEENFALAGGAVYGDIGAKPEFFNCRFLKNSSLDGGAVFCRGASSDGPLLVNCLLVGNTSFGEGGALHALDVSARLVNCTVVGNSASTLGGGLYGSQFSTLKVFSSILWDNVDGSGMGFAANLASGVIEAGYCTIEGYTTGLPGNQISGLSPVFANALGQDGIPASGDEDYTLGPGSPAVDAGDSAALPLDLYDLDFDGNRSEPLPIDLAGNPRLKDLPAAPNTGNAIPGYPVVDRGAFER